METIRIQVKESIYGKIMVLLEQFKQDEVRIVKEDEAFKTIQADLKAQLQQIDSGNVNFESIETLDLTLEERIKRHED